MRFSKSVHKQVSYSFHAFFKIYQPGYKFIGLNTVQSKKTYLDLKKRKSSVKAENTIDEL